MLKSSTFNWSGKNNIYWGLDSLEGLNASLGNNFKRVFCCRFSGREDFYFS